MKYLAFVIALLFVTPASAQTVYVWSGGAWVPMQCGGGACGGGSCGGWCPQGGGCQGGICCPQRPQQPAPQQDPEEIAGPLPQYEVRPQQPAPPLQPVPPAHPELPPAPVQPPAPTLDPNALKDQQAAIIKEIHDSQTTIEKSLVVIKGQKGCTCDNSKLEAAILALTQQNQSLVVAINELKNVKPPTTAPVASGPPAYFLKLGPHKEK